MTGCDTDLGCVDVQGCDTVDMSPIVVTTLMEVSTYGCKSDSSCDGKPTTVLFT